MLDLLIDNWDQLQDRFNSYADSEKDEMVEYFNLTINNLGDNLFGDDATPSDFRQFVGGFEVEQEKKFLSSVKEALLIEYE